VAQKAFTPGAVTDCGRVPSKLLGIPETVRRDFTRWSDVIDAGVDVDVEAELPGESGELPARLETEVALRGLLDRFPALRRPPSRARCRVPGAP
jgi:hypothetical protein